MLGDTPNGTSDLKEGIIQTLVFSDWLAIGWKGPESSEWRGLPITRAQDDLDYVGLATFVSFDCTLHLNVIAIVGIQKVGDHQEKNDISRFQVSVDFAVDLIAWPDAMIGPNINNALSSQDR